MVDEWGLFSVSQRYRIPRPTVWWCNPWKYSMVARQVYVISPCEAFKGTLMTSAEQCVHFFQVNVRHACVLHTHSCHSCFSCFTSLRDVCREMLCCCNSSIANHFWPHEVRVILETLPSTHQWSATAAMGKNMKKCSYNLDGYKWPFFECVHMILVPKHPRRIFLKHFLSELPFRFVTFVILSRFEWPHKEIWWMCGFSNTGSQRRWTTTQLYEENNKYEWTTIMECSR